MTKPFHCFRVYKQNNQIQGKLETAHLEELSPGEVVIRTHYSSINYKDALGATGAGKILRRFPLIAGVDVAGSVESSIDSRFEVGQEVVVTGCGLGEDHDGGYSEFVRVPSDWVVPLPDGLSTQEAMILGTAGFTAALCLECMERNGQTPQQGPVLVTGASGGVGQLAIQLLSQANYEVVAVSNKEYVHSSLKELGANQVCLSEELRLGNRPLEKGRWAGAIDNVGGELLSRIIPHIERWGNIACVGMAGGSTLKGSVFPMILRGVSLLGISSTNCPMSLRKELWNKLANQWKPQKLNRSLSQIISLDGLNEGFQSLLERRNTGRIIVKTGSHDC